MFRSKTGQEDPDTARDEAPRHGAQTLVLTRAAAQREWQAEADQEQERGGGHVSVT